MRKSLSGVLLFSLVLSLAAARMTAQRNTSPPVRVGANDLGGVVSGVNGPEAGVWVIAETGDLPTPFSKVVVTDGLGRYVIPDLPRANYKVWVRGYGLIDSAKTQTAAGGIVNLTATAAPT